MEYRKQFSLRLINNLRRFGVLPEEIIPEGIKGELAQVPHSGVVEANAFRKLACSFFKIGVETLMVKPKGFKVGFVCAVLLEVDRFVKAPDMDAHERESFYSLVIPMLGYGAKVDEVSMAKIEALFKDMRFMYENAHLLSHESRGEFFKGYQSGNDFVTSGDKLMDQGPDSSKVYFLIAFLGKNNLLLRSVGDLYRFIQRATNLNLKFDLDSFKKVCQDISWRGVKFARSMRSKKMGATPHPAAP